MAIATAVALARLDLRTITAPSGHPPLPRRAAAATFRLPPRIYSPYPPRRLVRPMAVPLASVEAAPAGLPGRLGGVLRGRRG